MVELAATRLIALHKNKGKSVAACLKSRTDYAQNPDKTQQGELVSSYECSPLTVDEEFMLSKRQYELMTGRRQKNDVIAYQIRQSFKPGEITAEEANKVGYELAMRFTKGKYAFKLAMMYRTKTLRPSQIPQTATRALRQLCRHRAELLNDVSSYKNRLTALLDQTFPGYDKVFSDVGGVTSCAVLVRFPTPTILLVEEESELVEVIAAASKSGYSFAKKKAGLLISAAQKAQTLGIHSCADETLIVCTIQMLRTLSESVLQIETAIDNLLAQIKEMRNNVSLLQSIPGIGSHSAALLLGEIGDISLFKKPKQLAAYFGLDPTERQSGSFRGTKNKLSKRGSSYARAALHMGIVNSICKRGKDSAANPVLLSYYEKKCKNKPAKVAQAASMHKLVFIIFAVLRDQKPFELKTPEQHAVEQGFVKAA